MMEIYKFGGASIKNADAVKNIYNIIKDCDNLIIVVSAIDKTTNALEKLHSGYINNSNNIFTIYDKIIRFHISICEDLFPEKPVNNKLNILFKQLQQIISKKTSINVDFEYDRIVSFGEMFSSAIIYRYLTECGLSMCHLDIRKVLKTNSVFKEAEIDWEISKIKLKDHLNKCNSKISLTQGFISEDKNGNITTLGREGSDFTAAALGFLSDAKSVTIWKDVPGIMNADPLWCNFAEKLDIISYQEAIELAFYGAKVIHPKTIKPLENKNIPLFVKSFINPLDGGTVIKKINYKLELLPIFILKENQTLISISPKDFSFIVEKNISKIFSLFVKHRIKVNMTQNSAISFSASVDNSSNINDLLKELNAEYSVKYNSNLLLITIRHYNANAIDKILADKSVFMEQRSRITARFVVSN